jgi:tetratricopeptide (TPR) repeat protein
MKTRFAVCLGLLLLCAAGAKAQTNVYGQVFMPSGDPPNEPIRFLFTSDDGMINDLRYTDSQGRFQINSLSGRRSYTIRITGDGVSFGDTVFQFPPLSGRVTRFTIDLNPPPVKKTAPGYILSAASGYRPVPRAEDSYQKALKEIQKRHFEQADPLLRKAVALDPKYALALNDLGALLMQAKKYPEAEQYLRLAVEADPKFIHALLNLGITLNHLEKYEESIAPLREALRLEPRLTSAHMHLGFALVSTAKYTEAEHELLPLQKLAVDNNSALIALYLGQLYARTGRYEKAISAFDSYLEKAPNAGNVADVRALVTKMQSKISARQ